MWFECEVNDSHYKVLVQETDDSWKVRIENEEKNSLNYNIPKNHFKKIDSTYSLLFKKTSHWIDIQKDKNSYTVYCKGSYRNIKILDEDSLLRESLLGKNSFETKKSELIAEMPGQLIKIFVQSGQKVTMGEPLLTLEAMKMQNELLCPFKEATVEKIFFKEGASVEKGDVLLKLEPKSS